MIRTKSRGSSTPALAERCVTFRSQSLRINGSSVGMVPGHCWRGRVSKIGHPTSVRHRDLSRVSVKGFRFLFDQRSLWLSDSNAHATSTGAEQTSVSKGSSENE